MNNALTQTIVPLTTISFPEIKLQTRDAHKLRGYFGNLFKEHSPILHNHYEDGTYRYKYPSVQYKVLNEVPTLVGLNEGAELLPQLFLKVKELELEGRKYPLHSKNIEHKKAQAGFSNELQEYSFETLWLALNQENYRTYKNMTSDKERTKMLNSILVGHVLSFFSNMDIMLQPEERLMARVMVKEKTSNFKNNKMLAFEGSFVINAVLPTFVGVGKSVSRGFGTIKRI